MLTNTDDESKFAAGADPTAPQIRPYGSWPSPLSIDDLVASAIGLSEPWLDGDDVYWVEGRPTEGGRRTLMRASVGEAPEELTPGTPNVRTRAHEYGGGAYTVSGSVVVYSDFADGRLYRLDPGLGAPIPITAEGPYRYADLRADPVRRRFFAVREDHSDPDRPAASIVAIPLDGETSATVLYEGPDFVAAPRPSPDGTFLAWIEWDHPDMPWDATRLRVAPIGEDGGLGASTMAAGGPEESIAQPCWSHDGILHLVSDRSGWWNLYRLVEGPRLEALAPMEAEFADPAWVFDRSSYAFLPDGSIVATPRRAGQDRLLHLVPGESVGEVRTEYTEFEGVRAGPGGVVALAASPTTAPVVIRLDPGSLEATDVLRRSIELPADPTVVAAPEMIAFPTAGDRLAYALFYRPTSPTSVGPDDERPPLLLLSHGGPTANTTTSFDLSRQFWTSRGVAVVDVDYGGSTGYGRDYRRRLDGAWGVVDIDDCEAAARFLVDRGDVDGARLAIKGGSAGGFTTLGSLAFRDTFHAGISMFGVGDLEMLARETHKFEARYLDRIVGPLPDAVERYRERSPNHHLDSISAPVLVLQGLDDRVVTPVQAEAIVDALAAKSIPYAYIAFEGEGHGFRGEDAIRGSLAAQLSFLGQVFGFDPADDIPTLPVTGLDEWRARSSTSR